MFWFRGLIFFFTVLGLVCSTLPTTPEEFNDLQFEQLGSKAISGSHVFIPNAQEVSDVRNDAGIVEVGKRADPPWTYGTLLLTTEGLTFTVTTWTVITWHWQTFGATTFTKTITVPYTVTSEAVRTSVVSGQTVLYTDTFTATSYKTTETASLSTPPPSRTQGPGPHTLPANLTSLTTQRPPAPTSTSPITSQVPSTMPPSSNRPATTSAFTGSAPVWSSSSSSSRKPISSSVSASAKPGTSSLSALHSSSKLQSSGPRPSSGAIASSTISSSAVSPHKSLSGSSSSNMHSSVASIHETSTATFSSKASSLTLSVPLSSKFWPSSSGLLLRSSKAPSASDLPSSNAQTSSAFTGRSSHATPSKSMLQTPSSVLGSQSSGLLSMNSASRSISGLSSGSNAYGKSASTSPVSPWSQTSFSLVSPSVAHSTHSESHIGSTLSTSSTRPRNHTSKQSVSRDLSRPSFASLINASTSTNSDSSPATSSRSQSSTKHLVASSSPTLLGSSSMPSFPGASEYRPASTLRSSTTLQSFKNSAPTISRTFVSEASRSDLSFDSSSSYGSSISVQSAVSETRSHSGSSTASLANSVHVFPPNTATLMRSTTSFGLSKQVSTEATNATPRLASSPYSMGPSTLSSTSLGHASLGSTAVFPGQSSYSDLPSASLTTVSGTPTRSAASSEQSSATKPEYTGSRNNHGMSSSRSEHVHSDFSSSSAQSYPDSTASATPSFSGTTAPHNSESSPAPLTSETVVITATSLTRLTTLGTTITVEHPTTLTIPCTATSTYSRGQEGFSWSSTGPSYQDAGKSSSATDMSVATTSLIKSESPRATVGSENSNVRTPEDLSSRTQRSIKTESSTYEQSSPAYGNVETFTLPLTSPTTLVTLGTTITVQNPVTFTVPCTTNDVGSWQAVTTGIGSLGSVHAGDASTASPGSASPHAGGPLTEASHVSETVATSALVFPGRTETLATDVQSSVSYPRITSTASSTASPESPVSLSDLTENGHGLPSSTAPVTTSMTSAEYKAGFSAPSSSSATVRDNGSSSEAHMGGTITSLAPSFAVAPTSSVSVPGGFASPSGSEVIIANKGDRKVISSVFVLLLSIITSVL